MAQLSPSNRLVAQKFKRTEEVKLKRVVVFSLMLQIDSTKRERIEWRGGRQFGKTDSIPRLDQSCTLNSLLRNGDGTVVHGQVLTCPEI